MADLHQGGWSIQLRHSQRTVQEARICAVGLHAGRRAVPHTVDTHSAGAIMTDKRTQAEAEHGNMQKNPDDWTTGDEPMTGAQKSYLHTLAEEAHEDIDDEKLTKAEASKKIDELKEKTGRGS
jgi:hypothetical protein